MHTFTERVARTIKDSGLLNTGETVIVGVSGGADSVALLDVLHTFTELRLKLVVAHLNHNLRGGDSDADAAFTAELADQYGLPFELRSIDVHRLSSEKRNSLEEAGRDARLSWFDELAAKHGAEAIALGHHADDQAETVLMRLLRGAGTAGLCGMSPKSAGRYIRPLLCVTRDEIEDYLNKRKIRFRIDGSNSDTRFLRNRIRHELLPFLKTYNPSIRDRLTTTAEILAADEELLESVTDKAFQLAAKSGPDGVHIHIPNLATEPRGLRYRLYRKAVSTVNGSLAHITSKHLGQIDDLVFSDRANANVTVPGYLNVAKCYQTLSFIPRKKELLPDLSEITISGPGIYLLPGNGYLEVSISPPPDNWGTIPPSIAYFDLAEAPFPWIARTFRAGDRFTPLGMTGTRKIKDFFIDMKIPPAQRRSIPLLSSSGTIFWIAGIRVAAQARITGDTREVAVARILEQGP